METRKASCPGIQMSYCLDLARVSAHIGPCTALEHVCPLVVSPGRTSGLTAIIPSRSGKR